MNLNSQSHLNLSIDRCRGSDADAAAEPETVGGFKGIGVVGVEMCVPNVLGADVVARTVDDIDPNDILGTDVVARTVDDIDPNDVPAAHVCEEGRRWQYLLAALTSFLTLYFSLFYIYHYKGNL